MGAHREPTSPAARRPGGLARGAAGLAALMAVAIAAALTHAPASASTTTYESPQFRYSVALPTGCRHEEGPGTLDAVCSPEFNAEKSAEAAAASALVLEVGAEPVPEDAGKPAAALAQAYDETRFKDELPEAICGEPDKARVKIENVKQSLEGERVVYTADVTCPEIKFLALGARQAGVRFLITPGMRYRLLARALKDDFEQNKSSIDAFFASFRIVTAEKKGQ